MARKMKDSGISWVGAIPAGWEVKKIASLYNVRNQKVSEKDFPALSVSKLGVVPQLSHVAKSNDTDNRKLVCAGDFAINSRSDRRGACGIAKQDGSVSLINIVLKPLENMEPGYFDWLFHSSLFADEFYKWGKGIDADVWSTHWTMMKKILVPYPPLPEQKRIAEYIDKTVGRIDGLREKISREIERLGDYKKSVISEAVCRGLDKTAKMKDSGIPWVGKIPAGWEVTRLNNCLSEVLLTNRNGSIKNALKFYFGTLIEKDNFDPDTDSYVAETIKNYTVVRAGDLVINGLNLNFDLVSLRVAQATRTGVITSAYIVMRPIVDRLSSDYGKYLLKSYDFKKAFHNMGTGVRKILTFTELKKALILLPPLAEQNRIAEYIDKQVAKIDALIEKRKAELERLEALKRSIICECVTGKREVA